MIRKFFICFAIFLLTGCNMIRPDKRDDLSRYEITVEVDGKQYVIKRTIQNWITYNWDTFQGASSGRKSDYGIFGQRIHDNQAIVIGFDYRKKSKPEDYTMLDDGTYVLSDPELLKHEFDIYLLDHYKDPQVIEMYDRIEAFNSPDARVKVIKKTYKKIPKIPFWPFQADGKDRYYDYDLEEREYPTPSSQKNFETRTYVVKSLSDDIILQILQKYPELSEKDIYRLESRLTSNSRGIYIQNRPSNHRSKIIYNLIRNHRSCFDKETEHFCRFYEGEKKNGAWEMILGQHFPKKIYRTEISEPQKLNRDFVYEFILDGNPMRINNDPDFRNSFLDFKQKIYYSFQVQHYHTREHK